MPERSEPTAYFPPVVASLLASLPSNDGMTSGLVASFSNLSKPSIEGAVTAAALDAVTLPWAVLAAQSGQRIAEHVAAPVAWAAGKQLAGLPQSPSLIASLATLSEKSSIGASGGINASIASAANIPRMSMPPIAPVSVTVAPPPTAKLMVGLFEDLQAEIRNNFAQQNVKIEAVRPDVSDINTKLTAVAGDLARLRQETVPRWVLITLLGLSAAAGLAAVALVVLVQLQVF